MTDQAARTMRALVALTVGLLLAAKGDTDADLAGATISSRVMRLGVTGWTAVRDL